MTAATPQALLALPPETQPSDAYLILHLAAFESDRTKIKAAADDATSRLNQARSSTDEGVWVTAAQWVKDAYSILSDASKKAAYDRKLTAILAAKAPAVDPLAGFLPGKVKTPATTSNQAQVVAPQAPVHASPAALTQAYTTPSTFSATAPIGVAPINAVRSRPRAKRGMPWFSIFLSLFSLAALGGLGGLLYLLQRGGLPTIVVSNDGVKVAASPDTDGDGRAVVLPSEVTDRGAKLRPYDPVMGGLGGDMPPPRPPEMLDDVGTDGSDPTVPPTDSPSMPMTEPPMPEMPAPVTPAPEMPAPPPTDEQIKAGDAAIATIVNAVKQHDWARMKQLAEDAQAAAASDTQKEQAEMIHQLVDLATYYHGGIKKGLATLQAGNELDITDDLKIVIVETGQEKLIVRFNGKNKEYTFDSIPLTLAHKIARLAMSGDAPTSIAAKQCYQAIAPVTTPPYREEAVAELEKITEEIEGAESAKLVAAIRFIYQP